MPHFEEVRDFEGWVKAHLKPSRKARSLAEKHGVLPYMVERYYHMLGDWGGVKDLLTAFDEYLNPVIRCNTLKVRECGDLESRLERLGYSLLRMGWCPNCFEVITTLGVSTLGATHEFLVGMYYLYRGPASLMPPLILNPSPGEFVADLAAAPGGKLTHMAQIMLNLGSILGVDVSRKRMRTLRSNVERLGVRNAVLLRIDGRFVPHIYHGFFQKALLDAPCTGEGLMMIDKSRKTKTTLNDLFKARELQVELLRAALNSVKEGGSVLYTTCSIAPEEDEAVIAEVLLREEAVEVLPIESPLKGVPGLTEYLGLTLPNDLKNCVRIYPHLTRSEGFFMCLLRRGKG